MNDLNILLKGYINDESIININEQIKRISEKVHTIKIPSYEAYAKSIESFAEVAIKSAHAMERISKSISTAYNINSEQSRLVTNNISRFYSTFNKANFSNLDKIIEFQVAMVKYLSSYVPEEPYDIAIENEQEIDYVTKEQLDQVVSNFNTQIQQMKTTTDIKWLFENVIKPMLLFIYMLGNLIMNYPEVKDNIDQISNDIEGIVETFTDNQDIFESSDDLSVGEKYK